MNSKAIIIGYTENPDKTASSGAHFNRGEMKKLFTGSADENFRIKLP